MRQTATKTFPIDAPGGTLDRFATLTARQRGQLLEMFERYAAGDRDAITHLVERSDPSSPGVAVHHTTAEIMRVMTPEP